MILPKDALTRLHVKKGDVIYLCESPEGYTLTPYNEDFVKQMTLAENIMHEDNDVLKVLAN